MFSIYHLFIYHLSIYQAWAWLRLAKGRTQQQIKGEKAGQEHEQEQEQVQEQVQEHVQVMQLMLLMLLKPLSCCAPIPPTLLLLASRLAVHAPPLEVKQRRCCRATGCGAFLWEVRC